MRGVCARARLTDRYFYENFAGRDQLLSEIWDLNRDGTLAMLGGAIAPLVAENPLVQLHAVIEAMVHQISEDPGGAQILFGDHAGSAALERRRRETIQTAVDIFVRLFRPYLRVGADEAKLRVSTLVGIGGFVETVLAWRSGTLTATADEMISSLDLVGASLAREFLEERSAEPSG